MSHEISQLDISGIQLRESKTQPKVSHSREIGEAQVVHTIFGRAKVRIIRKHDKIRRGFWMAAALGAAAIAAFVWQGWYADLGTAPMQSADGVPAIEKPTVAQPENFATPAMSSATIELDKPAPVESGKSLIIEKNASQSGMTASDKEVVKPVPAKTKAVTVVPNPVATQPKLVPDQRKPVSVQSKPTPTPNRTLNPNASLSVTPQPEAAGRAQTPPVAAGNNALKTQTATPTAAKPVPPKQPVAATITTMPVTPKVVVPASSPAAIPVLTAPLVKEDVPPQAPVADKFAAPLGPQSK